MLGIHTREVKTYVHTKICKQMFMIALFVTVQVQCRIQEAWGWCTEMTQRDGLGREVGGGFRMGNTCTPVADAC